MNLTAGEFRVNNFRVKKRKKANTFMFWIKFRIIKIETKIFGLAIMQK